MKTFKQIVLFILVCVTALLGPVWSPAMLRAAEPVILDTDMVDMFDDGIAMLMLAQSPQVELLGVTTVIGNSWVENGTASAIYQLNASGRADIPVVMGVNTVTRSGRIETMATEKQLFGMGADSHLGAAGMTKPASWQEVYRTKYGSEPAFSPTKEEAADFIIREVKAHPHQVTIVAIGTCGNLAAALRKAPEMAPLVKRVVYMGGAFFQQGNVMPNAEFNIWFDPEAARTAFRAPFPEQIIVPLDACEKIFFTQQRYNEVKKHLKNPAFQKLMERHWTSAMFAKDPSAHTYVWDILAAALVLKPSIISEEVQYPIDVNDVFSPSYGETMAFKGKAPIGARNAKIVLTVKEDMLWNMIFNVCDNL